MLSRKQKKFIRLFFVLMAILIALYSYAYQKGYSRGLAELLPAKSSQSKAAQVQSKGQISSEKFYSVVHIADGDTIDVLVDDQKVRVRLLGINSPESVAPNRPVECFGKEASNYISSLISNKSVRLELDPSKPEKDEYGRSLAYLFREDGLFINSQMIESGYAYEYTYHNERYKYQNDFKLAQAKAQKSMQGLWAKETCNGKK